MDFQIGDRVVVIRAGEGSRVLNGDTGIIVHFAYGEIGVEYDRYIGGHDCNGKSKRGHGWYLPRKCFTIISNNDPIQCATDDLVKTMLEGVV